MFKRSQLILSCILAGVVTPVLSVVFDQLGMALYEHDVRELDLFFPLLPAAVVLGAPFAIPVALLIRVRNTLAAIPFVAVAAALGIEAQERVLRLFEDKSAVSLWLMLVWIIPAILGTVAALSLKWSQRWTSLSITAIAIVVALVVSVEGGNEARERAPAYAAADSWSKLHVGMKVYTGHGSNAFGPAVCPTLERLYARQRDSATSCRFVAQGTPAIVDAVFPCKRTDPDFGYESPQVRLHAVNGSWNGFTEAAGLQPDVPVGTLLAMERDWGAPLVIENSDAGQTVIGSSAFVRLLRYDPKRDVSLYVTVLDGPY